MAAASCPQCKQDSNSFLCPSCGINMISKEEFSPEEGGAYPQLMIKKEIVKEKPSFFTWQDKLKVICEEIKEKRNARPANNFHK